MKLVRALHRKKETKNQKVACMHSKHSQ